MVLIIMVMIRMSTEGALADGFDEDGLDDDLCKWVGVHWPVWAAAFKRGPLCLISISL